MGHIRHSIRPPSRHALPQAPLCIWKERPRLSMKLEAIINVYRYRINIFLMASGPGLPCSPKCGSRGTRDATATNKIRSVEISTRQKTSPSLPP